MAKFVLGRPLTTRESSVVVDAGLPAGVHRFQLVVVGARGEKSAPDEVIVRIGTTPLIPDIRTTPVLPVTPLRPRTPRRKGNPP